MKAMVDSLRVSFRPTVLFILLLTTGLTATLAIGLQYYFSRSMAAESASKLYRATSTAIAAELTTIGKINNNVVELLAADPVLGETLDRDTALHIFTRVLQRNPLYYGIYIGRGDGGFLEVINLQNSDYARAALQADSTDRWVVVSVQALDGTRSRKFEYLDENLQIRATRSESTQYDVAQRAWYIDAMKSGNVTATDPYVFAQLGVPGITISKRMAQTDNVVGIDMTLSSISALLESQANTHHGEVYLYDSEGMVIASSRAQKESGSGERLPGTALLRLAGDTAMHSRLSETVENGTSWLVYVSRTGRLHQKPLFVGVRAREDVVMAGFMNEVKLSIAATAGFLLLILPLSWVFANPIVKPIHQLARENDKVRRREYDTVERVPTRVRELDELSESMIAMVDSIRAHELAQRKLMDSVIKLIAQAIDEKSAYTGGHCERVPELAMMLAQSASDSDSPAFREFQLESDDEWREFRIAAWLHDCGKITTPEHIVDKGSKLETIYNRIHEVRMRFEVLWRDAEIEYLRALSASDQDSDSLNKDLLETRARLQDDFAFVAKCNVGGEFLDDQSKERLLGIANRTWQRNFSKRIGLSPVEELRLPAGEEKLPATEQLLSDEPEHIVPRSGGTDYPAEMGIDMDIPEHQQNLGELYNLSVSRGTLTAEDRFRINEHMISTIRMLDGLPFPPELKNVPRYASTHHETMKGTGYPRRLHGNQLSIPERILAVADIFEALTASDRPYKRGKTLSEALDILHRMVEDHHVDRDCFELFVTEEVYLRYAQTFLKPDQIDRVEVGKYLTSATVQ